MLSFSARYAATVMGISALAGSVRVISGLEFKKTVSAVRNPVTGSQRL